MRHVISLSTIPPRFHQIGPTLRSLVRQTSRPEAVELYIPRSYRRFPEWGGGLPDVPEGVTIVRVDEDLGPATKVVPAALAWRGKGVELLYLDDDHVAPASWADRCLDLRRKHPDTVLCASGNLLGPLGRPPNPDLRRPRAVLARPGNEQFRYHLQRLVSAAMGNGSERFRPRYRMLDRSGHVDVAEGLGGVMIRPEFLDDMARHVPAVIWSVDDIWLSGHYERLGIPIWADRSLNLLRKVGAVTATAPLFRAEIDGLNRDDANRACIDHMRATYGIWGGVADQRT